MNRNSEYILRSLSKIPVYRSCGVSELIKIRQNSLQSKIPRGLPQGIFN